MNSTKVIRIEHFGSSEDGSLLVPGESFHTIASVRTALEHKIRRECRDQPELLIATLMARTIRAVREWDRRSVLQAYDSERRGDATAMKPETLIAILCSPAGGITLCEDALDHCMPALRRNGE